MSEADYALAGLRPALGRLANAMVAVLGPELRLGSPTYKLCTSVIREMQVRGIINSPSRESFVSIVLIQRLQLEIAAHMRPDGLPHIPRAAAWFSAQCAAGNHACAVRQGRC